MKRMIGGLFLVGLIVVSSPRGGIGQAFLLQHRRRPRDAGRRRRRKPRHGGPGDHGGRIQGPAPNHGVRRVQLLEPGRQSDRSSTALITETTSFSEMAGISTAAAASPLRRGSPTSPACTCSAARACITARLRDDTGHRAGHHLQAGLVHLFPDAGHCRPGCRLAQHHRSRGDSAAASRTGSARWRRFSSRPVPLVWGPEVNTPTGGTQKADAQFLPITFRVPLLAADGIC